MSWYGLRKTKAWKDFKENNPDKAEKYVELLNEQVERNKEGVNE